MKKFIKSALQEPWVRFVAKIVAALLAVSSILGLGYGVGEYKASLDCTYEKIKLQQEYNENYQSKANECKETERREYRLSKDELLEMLGELKKKGYGK